MNISTTETTTGISLRDHFAGLAMNGATSTELLGWTELDLAIWAYKQADAMLKAREVGECYEI